MNLRAILALALLAALASCSGTSSTPQRENESINESSAAAPPTLALSYWKQIAVAAPNEMLAYGIGITNTGAQVAAVNPYKVLATWHDKATLAEVARTSQALGGSLGANKHMPVEIQLKAPGVTGSFLLKIQLTDQSGASLESKGIAPLQYGVEVE